MRRTCPFVDRAFAHPTSSTPRHLNSHAVHDDELLALHQDQDDIYTLLDFLCAKVRMDDAGRLRLAPFLTDADHTARDLFHRHFNPQRFVQIAADPAQLPERRLMALAVLESGSPNQFHLKVGAVRINVSRIAWMIVKDLHHRGRACEAVAALMLFTKQNKENCETLIAKSLSDCNRSLAS